MKAAGWEPAVGDWCVDLRVGRYDSIGDKVAEYVTVKTVSDTLVITSDGEKYNRQHLHPTSEGRQSDRVLVPADDDRVLCVVGRRHLRDIAQLAENLASLRRKDPDEIGAALAQISAAAGEARRRFIRTVPHEGVIRP